MRRARRTAELAGFPNPTITPLLLEYDYGDYEGVTSAEIKSTRPDWELFRDGCPGGESPAQVYERARRFIELVVASKPNGRVAAFAHGHILRTLAVAWIEQPVLTASRLSLDTAALSVLRDGDHGHVLQLWNSTGEP